MKERSDNHQHTIVIQGMDSDGKLILSDDGDTNVHPGDIVNWKIDPESGVAAIYIMENPRSYNVFHPNPRQIPNCKSWQGTVNGGIKKSVYEEYSIFFFLDSGIIIGRDDPKIQVNP